MKKMVISVIFILFSFIIIKVIYESQTVKLISTLSAFNDKNYEDAYELAYEIKDDADAQNILGLLYLEGLYVKQDYKTAFDFFTTSSAQGNIKAQYNLGIMYLYGMVAPVDYKKAFNLIKESVNNGNEISKVKYDLALLYIYGKGTVQNKQAAINLFIEDGSEDNSLHQYYLGQLFSIAQDSKNSIYWYEKSANNGHALAQYELGLIYFRGTKIKQDIEIARSWIQKSIMNRGTYSLDKETTKEAHTIWFEEDLGNRYGKWGSIPVLSIF